jgi:O-antigen/teichoic acid export membrane protein
MRLFGTLLFVPVIIGLGILPSLVRLAQQDPENHIKMTRTTLGLFAAVSFPMAAGTTIIANNLIITLYDRSFEPSIPVLILLGWLVIPTYLNIGMAQSFIAEGRQKAWAWINILSIVINFFLNLGFITLAQNMWGNAAIGAAITMLICESITVLIGFKIMTKGIISRNLFFVAIKAMVSTGVMVLVLLPLRGTFFLIPIAVGGAVYAVMALITGLVPYSYQSKALRLPKRLIKREQSV